MKHKLLNIFRLRAVMFVALVCAAFTGVWAQSDCSTDYTGNVSLSTTGGTSASACQVVISNTSYAGIKAGTGKGKAAGAVQITVPSGTKYLHLHVAAWNGESVTLSVTPNGYSDAISLTSDSGISGNSPFTFSGSASTSDYYKVITFDTALTEATALKFTATSGKRFVVWGVKAEAEGGSSTAVATTTTIDATGITNTDIYTSTEAGSLAATVSVKDGDPIDGATVTWSGDNDAVATIDASTGAVTLVGAGTVTFTASYAGVQDQYTSSSDTYVLTVTDSAPYTGGDVTFDATADMGTSPLEKNGVTFTCSSGVLNNGSEYRLYKNSTTTLSVESGKITKIEFTGVSGNPASGFETQTGWTTGGNNGTWTGKASSVSFTASGAQVRATKIKVFVSNTATPTFSVAAGEYSEAKSIEISCATDGASIFYTTDGSTPTNSSTAYSSAILITESTTLKAIAIKDEVESAVASATYIMNRPATPIFDVAEGVFDAAFELHLSTETDDATIYYTTDGSTPTISSTEYSTKIAISSTTTVKAIAVKDGLTSDVASATYTYDSRTTPTFTLSTTSIDLKVNDTSSAVTLTTNSDGEVTFSCADDHVTLIGTGNSRTISANAAGTYTVNVSVSGSDTYKDAAGTITITVTKKATTMDLTPSFTSKDLYVTKTGSITGVPQYNSSAIDDAEVTYSSSNTSVATIASNGIVTFKKAGSTTITVSYEGNDEYEDCEASYNLDLTDSSPQATEVDITFGNDLYGTSYTGTNAAGKGPFEGSVNNIEITVTQGSGSNLYVTDSETRIYGGTTKGSITITAPTGYVLTEIIFYDGNAPSKWDISASNGTLSAATWTGSESTVVFSAGSRSDFTTATVTIAPVVTITSAGYATYASDHNLDFTETNIKAYIATTRGNGTGVAFTQINKVPAGTGVLLYVDGGATEAIPVFDPAKEDADGTDGNKFVRGTGGTIATDDGVNYNYILNNGVNGIGFYKANNKRVAVNRAYICIPKDEIAAADAKDFFSMPGFDDDPTGINDLADKTGNERNEIYNLAGQRINKLQKGINIINGKKIMK